MNLKETLRYMESQLLNEGVVGRYNSLKKKGLDDDTIYQRLSKEYKATEEQIKQEIQTKQQQQKQFNQNQKTINDAKGTDRDNSSEVIDNLNLKNAMKQNSIKELNTQSGKLFQYYQTISSGEELKQKIDSFDKLLNQTQEDLNKIIQTVDMYNKDPDVKTVTAQANQEISKSKQKAKKSGGLLKGLSGLLSGALNAVAGVAGNFIGGIASGMGGAR